MKIEIEIEELSLISEGLKELENKLNSWLKVINEQKSHDETSIKEKTKILVYLDKIKKIKKKLSPI